MNDSPPKEPTFDEMVAAAKSQIERDRLYRQIIGRDKPAMLLDRQEQGEILTKQAAVIRAQNRLIEHQATTIARLMEEIGQYQDIIEMLCGEDGE